MNSCFILAKSTVKRLFLKLCYYLYSKSKTGIMIKKRIMDIRLLDFLRFKVMAPCKIKWCALKKVVIFLMKYWPCTMHKYILSARLIFPFNNFNILKIIASTTASFKMLIRDSNKQNSSHKNTYCIMFILSYYVETNHCNINKQYPQLVKCCGVRHRRVGALLGPEIFQSDIDKVVQDVGELFLGPWWTLRWFTSPMPR